MTKQIHHFNDVDQPVFTVQLDKGRFMAITEDRQHSGFGDTMLASIAELSRNMAGAE